MFFGVNDKMKNEKIKRMWWEVNLERRPQVINRQQIQCVCVYVCNSGGRTTLTKNTNRTLVKVVVVFRERDILFCLVMI